MMKLIPLSVPWMISPSMPNLKMISEEDGQTLLLQFFALFAFEPVASHEIGIQGVGIGAQGLKLDANSKSGRHQLVSLKFKNVGWFRRSPQYSDREVVNESLFDWSRVSGMIRKNEEASDWQHRCLSEWAKNRIAPNPSAYVVLNSEWNQHEAERWGLKHYLILGDSSSVEVLAEDVEWTSEGSVLGW